MTATVTTEKLKLDPEAEGRSAQSMHCEGASTAGSLKDLPRREGSRRCDLAQLALTQVGTWCYVWGGNGQDMTAMSDTEREKWICKRESEEENRERVRKLYAKLAAKGIDPIRGGDCSGFVYWCMKTLGVWKSDMNANTMYQKTTRTDEPEAGDLAFRLTDGKATHVGVCVGNGYFVHCKGRDDGVVKEKSKASYWQAYGIIKEFDPEPQPDPPDPKPDPDPPSPTGKYVRFLGSVNLRREPKLTGKQLRTMHKGNKLPLLSRGYFDERGCEWYAVDSQGEFLYCSAYTDRKKKYTEVE